MAVEGAGSDLIQVVALLGAGVVAVPIFKRAGLGSILGYLRAGIVIGLSASASSTTRRRSFTWPNWAS